MLEVVAGILRNEAGDVLLAQRLPHKSHPNLWEFPGGKMELGESQADAVRRELKEELGIEVQRSAPFFSLVWRYPGHDAPVRLHALEILQYAGSPSGQQGQRCVWVEADVACSYPMPSADYPIAAALRIGRRCLITPEPDLSDRARFLRRLRHAMQQGVSIVQFRSKGADECVLKPLAAEVVALCRDFKAKVVINDHSDWALQLGFDGVHLSQRRFSESCARPLPRPYLCGVSCHSDHEMQLALERDFDFVTLSPVLATASHPDAVALGWRGFAKLAADYPLPILALGGLAPRDLQAARHQGAFGIAGIRAFWSDGF